VTALIRFSIIAIVSFLVALAFAVYDVYFSIAEFSVIQELRNAYRWRSVIVAALEHLPLILATAGIITFSLAINPYDLGSTGLLVRSAQPVLFAIVVVGVIGGVWIGVFEPQVIQKLHRMEYRSGITQTAFDDANTAYRNGDFDRAEGYVRLYLSVVGESEEAETLLTEIRETRAVQRQSERIAAFAAMEEGEIRRTDVSELTVGDLYKKARDNYENGQYYSAHYYATQAVALSNGRTDIRELQSDALNAIEEGAATTEDKTAQAFYRRKQTAYQLLSPGNPIQTVDPESTIRSYYLFQELQEDAPEDPDVLRYLGIARNRVQSISFFVDEARRYEGDAFGGRTDLVLRYTDRSGATNTISIDRVVYAPEGVFFYDIEVLQTTREDTIHFRGSYGKHIADRIVLRAIDRGIPADGIADDSRDMGVGAIPFGDTTATPPQYISLQTRDGTVISPEELALVGSGTRGYRGHSIVDLVQLPRRLSVLGESPNAALSALAERLLRMFGIFIAPFVAISLGWRYRGHYLSRPPFLVLVAIPVVPVVLWWLRDIPRFLIGLYVNRMILTVSASTVIISTIGILLLVLVLSIAYVSRQRIEV
jgi:hypothetical protein